MHGFKNGNIEKNECSEMERIEINVAYKTESDVTFYNIQN